ncbi:hypothetical protein A4S02_09520 [Acetobacter ascendens]|uniref:Uncharacterized protein n=1 Tax=Acetobacter ascendens TaxID=481146 RepID=A0A1D8QXA3_9PROT|nr:hypothetical protein [Acetobacter ascendens]AOW46960.1 hypothetical protein A4S02_09520 [Acetobacter ascendens]
MPTPPAPSAPRKQPLPNTQDWPPLPGTRAYMARQLAQDTATVHQIVTVLQNCAGQITPLVAQLYFTTGPLTVLDCAATMHALADDIAHDDPQTLAELAAERSRTG